MRWAGPLEDERFARIRFENEGHVYFIDDRRAPQSGTGVLKDRFHFDPWAIVRKFYEKWAADADSPYFQTIADHYDEHGNGHLDAMAAIVDGWAAKGELAAPAGTAMHADIENYAQGKYDYVLDPGVDFSPELRQYVAVAATLGAQGWTVVGVEVLIFYEMQDAVDDGLIIFAGAIDMLLRHADTGQYRMIDHKRVPRKKGKLLGAEFGRPWPFEMAGAPFDALGNNSSHKYAAQLNLYAYALKHRYGIDCDGRLDLLQMHEDLDRGHLIRVPDLRDSIAKLVDIEAARLRSHPEYASFCLKR